MKKLILVTSGIVAANAVANLGINGLMADGSIAGLVHETKRLFVPVPLRLQAMTTNAA